jgi:hypothetical protein
MQDERNWLWLVGPIHGRLLLVNTLHRLLPLLALISVSPVLSAQIPKSQLGSIMQSVGETRVDITYRRPVARGRVLFGALVPWGRVWSPSSDTAARFSISTPIEINGAKLAAGTYSIWAIPDSTSWTVIFSGVPTVFHLKYPEGQDKLRVRATPTHGEHVETLTFAFPLVDGDSARLELRWGTTIVPLSIRGSR